MSGDTPHAAVIRMGHDISRQFRTLDDELAVEAIATHIARFWEPRMREQLIDCVAIGDHDVDPHLAAAARRLTPPDIGRPDHDDPPAR